MISDRDCGDFLPTTMRKTTIKGPRIELGAFASRNYSL